METVVAAGRTGPGASPGQRPGASQKSAAGQRNRRRRVRRPRGMRPLASARPRRLDALAPLALGAVAAVALSACAVTSGSGSSGSGSTGPDATASARPASTLVGSTGVPATAGKTPARPSLTPRMRAVADADEILASFVRPAGARALTAAPTVDKGALKSPSQVPGTPDLVDKAEWWIAPGAPQSVLAWEARHLSHRFSTAGTGTSYGPHQATIWSQDFSLPAIPAVLDSRDLSVEVVQDGSRTAIRVDAQVTWQPARLAGEKVPAAAKAVTVALNPGLNQGGRKPPAPVTITDPAKVRALTALIDGLAPFPPGVFSCPADFGDSLVLTFRAGPGGPAFAVATADLGGCNGVNFTIGGKAQPALAGPGTDVGPQILKTAGLSWKIPTN